MEPTQTDRLIVEGLVLTTAADGSPHLAPMGPQVDRQFQSFTLRPFCTSQTFANFERTRTAVFHVTDNVELIARSAIGRMVQLPEYQTIDVSPGYALADCCRWFALRATTADLGPPRATFHCEVIQSQHVRDWFGFNRAKHAVVEAAILATRIGILPAADIRTEMARLESLVQKTAGEQERIGWELLCAHIQGKLEPE
ncbi:hypothetical protein ETAA8_55850 [Anatilimnocola aggregata]|uniref:DUF447 family protein n=1 Tax=Anatilimnocola aggregata TaxID=2528021 RepID=A0A517YJP6_9BACT|nr:DUF447 domain-containing protein [Anatilimnocola aggregata]QDU30445.1 hypothetical protein ETAA8_55850 [Anatilimnocola aggregata]